MDTWYMKMTTASEVGTFIIVDMPRRVMMCVPTHDAAVIILHVFDLICLVKLSAGCS